MSWRTWKFFFKFKLFLFIYMINHKFSKTELFCFIRKGFHHIRVAHQIFYKHLFFKLSIQNLVESVKTFIFITTWSLWETYNVIIFSFKGSYLMMDNFILKYIRIIFSVLLRNISFQFRHDYQ